MAGKKLARNVTALDEGGRWVTYMAGTVPPAKVAAGIDNPKAWESEEESAPEGAEPEKS